MKSLNEFLNEEMDNYIKSTDGKTFTILDKSKKEIKTVSKDELEKLMRVDGAYASNMSWQNFIDKFDKTTGKGKHWKYWKGAEVSVSIKGLNESKFKGNISGDVIDSIIKELSYYKVSKADNQPLKNYIILSVGVAKKQQDVIDMLKDLYGLNAKPYEKSNKFITIPSTVMIDK